MLKGYVGSYMLLYLFMSRHTNLKDLGRAHKVPAAFFCETVKATTVQLNLVQLLIRPIPIN